MCTTTTKKYLNQEFKAGVGTQHQTIKKKISTKIYENTENWVNTCILGPSFVVKTNNIGLELGPY